MSHILNNMAKKQRGKKTSTATTPQTKNDTDYFNLNLDSSDDEAPEEVTFQDSKAQALRSMKRALDTARREKELLKEKRRKRQELFQQQKKRKLLPADVLVEIESTSSIKQKQSEDEAEEQQHEDKEVEEEGEEKKRKKRLGRRNLKGNNTVTTLQEQTLALYQQQAAEDFLQSRLYGPGSCRTTNNELLSLHNKTGQNKSSALQFVKKDWAHKQKAKAEKLKKRWIHKQQIPSC